MTYSTKVISIYLEVEKLKIDLDETIKRMNELKDGEMLSIRLDGEIEKSVLSPSKEKEKTEEK